MKASRKISKITQWLFVGLFALCTLANGINVGSIFLLGATILMMPLPVIRNLLHKRKVKNWMAVSLSVFLLFAGILLSPESASNETINNSLLKETVTEKDDNISSDLQDKENSITDDSISSEITSDTPSTNNSSADSNLKNNQTTNTVGKGSVTPVQPSSVEAYSGKAYIIINNNQPSFSAAELTTNAYESYGNLDRLGRCTIAIASCGKEIMPAEGEERGSISSITPTGWKQAKYDSISGKYLYNRCHLIGWQLSAENANKKNLITGTRYLNTEGMLPFENMVADYIKETGNHVAYRITPIFEGNNLLASGVQMEAYSIEDNGDGICFNVYCYNVQPGITINYATGSSSIQSSNTTFGTNSNTESNSSSTTQPSTSVTTPDNDSTQSSGQTVYRTPSGKKYHLISTCGGKNSYEVSLDAAISAGLGPCAKCAQ